MPNSTNHTRKDNGRTDFKDLRLRLVGAQRKLLPLWRGWPSTKTQSLTRLSTLPTESLSASLKSLGMRGTRRMLPNTRVMTIGMHLDSGDGRGSVTTTTKANVRSGTSGELALSLPTARHPRRKMPRARCTLRPRRPIPTDLRPRKCPRRLVRVVTPAPMMTPRPSSSKP